MSKKPSIPSKPSTPKPFVPGKPSPDAPKFTPPKEKPKKGAEKSRTKELTITDPITGEKRPMTQKEIADHNSRSIRQVQNNIPSDILIKLGMDFGSEAAKGTAVFRDKQGIL